MRLKITCTLKEDEQLVLPINYLHILQAVIYNCLRTEDGLSDYIHDVGLQNGGKTFRPFIFSWLRGLYKVADKKICFTDTVEFEVRSLFPGILECIKFNIENNGLRIGTHFFENPKAELSNIEINDDRLRIRMLSPICTYSTLKDGKTHYYCPDEAEFFRTIEHNFIHKYETYYKREPLGDISLKAVHVSRRDRVVTSYQNTRITAWYGIYELSGLKEYLDFSFHTGLGAKNSQGFGMFYIQKEREV